MHLWALLHFTPRAPAQSCFKVELTRSFFTLKGTFSTAGLAEIHALENGNSCLFLRVVMVKLGRLDGFDEQGAREVLGDLDFMADCTRSWGIPVKCTHYLCISLSAAVK